jgi:hypothetical protein
LPGNAIIIIGGFANQELGEGKDLSMEVQSSTPILVERPMYFKYS